MDAADRELFAQSIHRAAERAQSGSLDAALDDIGWREALTSDRQDAIEVLFEQQGFVNARSYALDQVLLSASLAEIGDTAGVVLPLAGEWGAPGVVDAERLAVRGLGTQTLADNDNAVVIAAQEDKHVAVVVPRNALDVRRIQGIDPSYGLVEVTGECAAAAEQLVEQQCAADVLVQRMLGRESDAGQHLLTVPHRCPRAPAGNGFRVCC